MSLPGDWLSELCFSFFNWFCCFARKKRWNRNSGDWAQFAALLFLPAPFGASHFHGPSFRFLVCKVGVILPPTTNVRTNRGSRVGNINYTGSVLHMCSRSECSLLRLLLAEIRKMSKESIIPVLSQLFPLVIKLQSGKLSSYNHRNSVTHQAGLPWPGAGARPSF